MKLWKWKAVDKQGRICRGLWKENELDDVVEKLFSQQLYPLRIRRSVLGLWRERFLAEEGKLYWARSCRRMGTFLQAGIPLLTSLEIIESKETNSLRKHYWLKLKQNILAGKELSASMEEFHPRPGFFLESLLKAGEKSGTLAQSFLEGAEQLEEEYYWEQKLKTILFYPSLLFVLTLLIMFFLSVLVLPMYQNIFQDMDAQLPWLTSAVFLIGSFIPYLGGAALGGFLIMKVLFPQSKIRIMPGTAQIRRYRLLVQFCTLLARLLKSGLPLLDTLIILQKLNAGSELQRIFLALESAVRAGNKLASVISGYDFFPPETEKMVDAAEESGKLTEMLEHLGSIFRQELEEKIRRYTRFLEPVLILGMALMVAFVALGVLWPIFELSMQIQ